MQHVGKNKQNRKGFEVMQWGSLSQWYQDTQNRVSFCKVKISHWKEWSDYLVEMVVSEKAAHLKNYRSEQAKSSSVCHSDLHLPIKSLSFRFDIPLYPLRFFSLLQLGQSQLIQITTEFQPFPLNSGIWRHGLHVSNQKQQSQALGIIRKAPSILTGFYSAATKGSE